MERLLIEIVSGVFDVVMRFRVLRWRIDGQLGGWIGMLRCERRLGMFQGISELRIAYCMCSEVSVVKKDWLILVLVKDLT
jgi:hypothetical protein